MEEFLNFEQSNNKIILFPNMGANESSKTKDLWIELTESLNKFVRDWIVFSVN